MYAYMYMQPCMVSLVRAREGLPVALGTKFWLRDYVAAVAGPQLRSRRQNILGAVHKVALHIYPINYC